MDAGGFAANAFFSSAIGIRWHTLQYLSGLGGELILWDRRKHVPYREHRVLFLTRSVQIIAPAAQHVEIEIAIARQRLDFCVVHARSRLRAEQVSGNPGGLPELGDQLSVAFRLELIE